MTPRTDSPRRRARSARRPASSGGHPHRGMPTLTSITTSRTPPSTAASMVASESTATVTRVVGDDQAPEAVGVEHLVGKEQVFDQPGRGQAFDLVDRRGREARVTQLALALGEHRALVGLHVRTQPCARQRVGHGRQVVLERGDVDQQRRGLELGDPHAADPTPDAREGAAEAAPSQGLGVRGCYDRVTRRCRRCCRARRTERCSSRTSCPLRCCPGARSTCPSRSGHRG